MIFWIATGIIVILTLFFSRDMKEEIFAGWFAGVFIWAVVCLLIIGVIGGIAFAEKSEKHYPYVHHMVSLSDLEGSEGEIHGGLFFISGFIGSYQFYSWYERDEDGSYEAHQISTRDTPVKVWEEPAGARPRAVEHNYCKIEEEPSWLSPIDFTQPNPGCFIESWDLYVPAGTITHEFKLDGP